MATTTNPARVTIATIATARSRAFDLTSPEQLVADFLAEVHAHATPPMTTRRSLAMTEVKVSVGGSLERLTLLPFVDAWHRT